MSGNSKPSEQGPRGTAIDNVCFGKRGAVDVPDFRCRSALTSDLDLRTPTLAAVEHFLQCLNLCAVPPSYPPHAARGCRARVAARRLIHHAVVGASNALGEHRSARIVPLSPSRR
jgi:hypothetical protein